MLSHTWPARRAGGAAVASRGQQFFTSKHGREWACASCHGADRLGIMGPALLPESLERVRPAEVLRVIGQGRTATVLAGNVGKRLDATRKHLVALRGALRADSIARSLPEGR